MATTSAKQSRRVTEKAIVATKATQNRRSAEKKATVVAVPSVVKKATAGLNPSKRKSSQVIVVTAHGIATASFGSVTVKVVAPSDRVVKKNIEDGQAALARAKPALMSSGVKISRQKGKPIYYGSPDSPDLIIREIDGVRSVGTFSQGRFRVRVSKPEGNQKSQGRARGKAR